MANNEFVQSLIEILLSWVRVVTSWVWSFFQADMGSGFISWFGRHWMGLSVTLIVIGMIIDWIIWMIRWRPYWLWLRKRQIIYEDVEDNGKTRADRRREREKLALIASQRHMPLGGKNDYIDPFAVEKIDPYASKRHVKSHASPDDEPMTDWEKDWDIDNDPYERVPRKRERERNADHLAGN